MINFDVFISYSSKDKAAADASCAALESAGVRCWMAPRDITPGTDWGEAIMMALDHCRAMVLIFSASANSSPQIRREIERAVNRGVPILPVRIEDIVPTKALAYFMGPVHWLDAMTPPLDNHLRRLAEVAKTILRPAPDTSAAAAEAQPEAVAALVSAIPPPAPPPSQPSPSPSPEQKSTRTAEPKDPFAEPKPSARAPAATQLVPIIIAAVVALLGVGFGSWAIVSNRAKPVPPPSDQQTAAVTSKATTAPPAAVVQPASPATVVGPAPVVVAPPPSVAVAVPNDPNVDTAAATPVPATPAPGAKGNYGATAAGISGDKVGVGYSTNYSTQSAADARALKECEARSNNCKVMGRFWNGGCGYITTASSDGTCYGYGATAAEALSECQSRGCKCQTPIGGCTATP
jgi:hypothetical protein